MKAIVTGATGFVGRWLVGELLKNGTEVIAVIRPRSSNRKLLPENPQLSVVECAMDNYEELPMWIRMQKGSVWFHLAWEGVSGTKRSDLNVQLCNIQAAQAAVYAASAVGCDRFIGLGSIMEEEAVRAVNTDGSTPGLGYIYGAAKYVAHLLTKSSAAEKRISHIWAVLTNAYGEYEWSSRFINSTLHKILRGEPLEFTAGTQMYDFIHVEDAAKALVLLGKNGKPFHQYVIGSGNAAPLRTFIETIGTVLAPEQQFRFGDIPYTGVQLPQNSFSIKSLQLDTGFEPGISFENGLVRTMNWIAKEDMICKKSMQ